MAEFKIISSGRRMTRRFGWDFGFETGASRCGCFGVGDIRFVVD
jgi:hypothetical protein